MTEQLETKVTEVFRSEKHCFFGYYDRSPFDGQDRRLIGHQVSFHSDRMPHKEDTADILLWDLSSGRSEQLARTHTFNWQQGSMLQWLGPDFCRRVLFNDFRDNSYVSVILDLEKQSERIISHPSYTVSSDGQWALGVCYDRLFWCRPSYSYACGGDSTLDTLVSPQDGIWLMDLETGISKQIITTQQMFETGHLSSMETGANYLEHLLISPSNEKFMFFHRWQTPDGGLYTRVYVANRDGSCIRLVSESGDVSHYNWLDDDTLILFGGTSPRLNRLRRSSWAVKALLQPLRPIFKAIVRPHSQLNKVILPTEYFLLNISTREKTRLGKYNLTVDGHPSFNPRLPHLLLSDTYEDANDQRHLYVHDLDTHVHRELLSVTSPTWSNGQGWRCDLHPRWNRKGTRVCIDSLHTGTRRIHVYDVERVLDPVLS
ncbi:MAG: hypothetical protein QGH15_19060 [Kiritimatiellia bacterium]|nr:hypothetical protein [Kiritimatiellia bacterium]